MYNTAYMGQSYDSYVYNSIRALMGWSEAEVVPHLGATFVGVSCHRYPVMSAALTSLPAHNNISSKFDQLWKWKFLPCQAQKGQRCRGVPSQRSSYSPGFLFFYTVFFYSDAFPVQLLYCMSFYFYYFGAVNLIGK